MSLVTRISCSVSLASPWAASAPRGSIARGRRRPVAFPKVRASSISAPAQDRFPTLKPENFGLVEE